MNLDNGKGNNINTDVILDYIYKNHITKTEFCKLCGISASTLNKILKNKNVSIMSLYKISRYMNLYLHNFFI